ncbi:MAG: hypothetical protein ACRCYB_03065 [Aeromonas veronii]
MKISNSKKELARIISENGGWRDGAEWAAQDKNGIGMYSGGKPYWDLTYKEWAANAEDGRCIFVINGCNTVSNYHQCILSRAEYFHLYPAPDADGWIEWQSPFFGGMPVGENEVVDIRVGDDVHTGFAAKDWKMWGVVTHYRLHKPEQAKPEFCESVTRSIPDPETKPTIEQLAADYRNRKACADRKQEEADAAKADAEAKLAELVAAGKALNLVISVAEEEPELVITDWRDWIIGDLVMLVNLHGGIAKVGEVGKISKAIGDGDFYVDFPSQSGYSVEHTDVKFIRRP